MPWQDQVALVGGEFEINDSGLLIPCYRTVVFTVPRQSGKTTIILAWEIHRGTGWVLRPQKIVYSAQTGNDARKKLVEDQFPQIEVPPSKRAKLGVARCLKGMGNEAIEFRNGSRLVLLASMEESGHGKTVDLAVEDELFADTDGRRDGALVPGMNTRDDAQMLVASTMGTAASIPWNRLVTQGRRAVEKGIRRGIAYFEWSAPRNADPDDPEVWWACMPALGFTITEDVVRDARLKLTDAEFRRAYLNITDQRRGDSLFPSASWDLVNEMKVKHIGRLVFGLAVQPDRSAAAIVVASESGAIEVIDHRPGTGWVVERACEISEKHEQFTWAVAKPSPAASLIPAMEKRDLDIRTVGSDEYSSACGQFYDAVADNTITVLRSESMDEAIGSAEKRNVGGDKYVWDRRGETDITPLEAATVAAWIVDTDEEIEDFAFSA